MQIISGSDGSEKRFFCPGIDFSPIPMVIHPPHPRPRAELLMFLYLFPLLVRRSATEAAILTATVATVGAWVSSVQTEMLLIPLRSQSHGWYTAGVCIQREASRQMSTGDSAHKVGFEELNAPHNFCHFIIDNRDGEVLMIGSLLPGEEDPVPDFVSFLQACASGSTGTAKTGSSGPLRPHVRCVWWSPRGADNSGDGFRLPRQQRLSAVLDRGMLCERRFMDAVLCSSFTESAVRTKCPSCHLREDITTPCTCGGASSFLPPRSFNFTREIQQLGGTFVGTSVMMWRRPGTRKLKAQKQCLSFSLGIRESETPFSEAFCDIAPNDLLRDVNAETKVSSPAWNANLLDLEDSGKGLYVESFFDPDMYLGTSIDDLCLPLGDSPDIAGVEDLGRLLYGNDPIGTTTFGAGCSMTDESDSFSLPSSPSRIPAAARGPDPPGETSASPCGPSRAAVEESTAADVDIARIARAELRRTKNREAARRSNLRRKQHNDFLKSSIKESRSKVKELRTRQNDLWKENESLRIRLRGVV